MNMDHQPYNHAQDTANNPSNHLRTRLLALPEQDPPEDRFAEIVSQLAIAGAIQPEQRGQKNVRRWPWLALAASLVLTLGVAGLFNWQPHESHPSEYAVSENNEPVNAPANTGPSSPANADQQWQLTSQWLEQRYRAEPTQTRTSIQQRQYQRTGQWMLSVLDQALTQTPDDPQLWQQRVQVLHTLEQADALQARGYQPVILTVN